MGKLVRDRIPEIMRREGKTPNDEHVVNVGRVSGERLREALKDKLVEEAMELHASEDVRMELVDVLEVADAIIAAYGLDPVEIEELKNKKRAERGGFKEGYFLND